MKHSVLAASLIGGALVLSGGTPASAATLAPTLDQPVDTAAVHKVTHDPRAHPRRYGQRYVAPRYRVRPGFRHYGPSVAFGLTSPRYHSPAIGFGITTPGFSFGLGVPHRYHTYGYGYRRW